MSRLLDPKRNGEFPFKYEPARTHTTADYLREKLERIRREVQGVPEQASRVVRTLKRKTT